MYQLPLEHKGDLPQKCQFSIFNSNFPLEKMNIKVSKSKLMYRPHLELAQLPLLPALLPLDFVTIHTLALF